MNDPTFREFDDLSSNNYTATADSGLSPSHLQVDDFFPNALSMRSEFETHFAQPYKRYGPIQEIWDYWYVPGMYAYLRTDPYRIFSAQLFDSFVNALSTWSFSVLGLRKFSRPYVSMYVNGCSQELHNDSRNGRFAYVFSLTEWTNRRFSGGETLIFKEEPYWGSARIAQFGAGNDFYTLIPSHFNRLLVFDDRLIHGVRQIQGSMDPRDSRLVIHGHISEDGVVTEGPLGLEYVTKRYADDLPQLLEDLPGRDKCHGFVTLRLKVGASGRVESIQILCNRILPTSPNGHESRIIASLLKSRLSAMSFPERQDGTTITMPIVL